MRKNWAPRPWQIPMLQHALGNPRCALWAGMGLGKTSLTLAVLDALYLGGESRPTLILGPKRVARSTWVNEAAKWNQFSHLSVVPIMGTPKERLAALKYDAPIFTTNYDNLVWLIEHFGDRWPFGTVVPDESTRVKGLRISEQVSKNGKVFYRGQGAVRAGALARIAHTHIDRIIELTGTPAPNGLIDLWGQLWLLDKGARLGKTVTAFKQRWFQKSFDGYGSVPLDHADREIHERVKDLCLTIDPKDWLDLDAPIVNKVYVDLPPKARAIYKAMEKDMFAEIEGRTSEAFNAAARTQKCLQMSNGAVYVDPSVDNDEHPRAKEWRLVHDEKIDALESIIAETAGANLLIVYEFKSDLARLLKAFPQAKMLNSEENEEGFRRGKIKLGLIHPKSASHGIDGWQNHCCNIVFFGVSWNLEDHQQVIERVGPVRQMQSGTGKPCFIHYILARDTVDDLVLERLETKRNVQEILLEACKRRRD